MHEPGATGRHAPGDDGGGHGGTTTRHVLPAKTVDADHAFFVSVASDKYQLLLMINILLVALSTFMDWRR